MAGAMAADVATIFLHFLNHIKAHGAALSVDVFAVEKNGKRVAEFFENRISIGVDRFPAVIDGDQYGAWRDGLFPAFPCLEILHADDAQTLILECLHLLAEFIRIDAHLSFFERFGKVVIAEDGDANSIIGDLFWFGRDGHSFGRIIGAQLSRRLLGGEKKR